MSHKSTAECFEIEDDIISRVMQNVYVKTCDVYARISSDRLEIYADVTGKRGRIRVNERGTFVNKNLIITKIVDRISKVCNNNILIYIIKVWKEDIWNLRKSMIEDSSADSMRKTWKIIIFP